MKTALVGFAFGAQSYIQNARYLKENNWDIYADKHGYDSYLFDTLLDETMHRSNIMMQKLLVFNRLSSYDRIIYLDTDVVINPLSPAFPFTSQSDQIWSVPFVPWEGVSGYCDRFNLKWDSLYLPQGGVIGLQGSPSYDLFEKIYWGKDLEQEHPVHAPDQILMGMPFLLKDKCQWIDYRFNYNPEFFSKLHPFAWNLMRYEHSSSKFLRNISRVSRKLGQLNSQKIVKGLRLVLPSAYYWHFAGAYKQYIHKAIEVFRDI